VRVRFLTSVRVPVSLVAQMSDVKSSVQSASLKLWTERLSPAIGTVLLPELIRLLGEYCLSRLSWSPVLRSKRILVIDADAEGFGRCLQFLPKLPAGEAEAESLGSWYTALSSVSLRELASDSPVFSWTVRVDEWDQSSLMLGVMSVDAKSVAPEFAVHERGRGVLLCSSSSVPSPTQGNWESPDMPLIEKGTVLKFRMTADLTANTLRFAAEHVPSAVAGEAAREESVSPLLRIGHSSWFLTVPDLQRCHFYAVGGFLMRLTLTP
jgi:hypothetical protein